MFSITDNSGKNLILFYFFNRSHGKLIPISRRFNERMAFEFMLYLYLLWQNPFAFTHTLIPWESTMKWSSSLILRQSGWIQAVTLTNKPNQTHHFVSVISNMLSVEASLSHCDWPWDVHYFQRTARLLLFWNHQHSKCCVITGKFIWTSSQNRRHWNLGDIVPQQ